MSNVPPYVGLLKLGDKTIGTGFIIDDSGLIATCYDVIKAVGEPPAGKQFTFQLAGVDNILIAIVTAQLDPVANVGLLQLVGSFPDVLTIASLIESSAVISHMPFYLYGYGESAELGPNIHPAKGQITGHITIDGIDFLALDTNEILLGMGGAPIIVDQLGGIVGVLVEPIRTHPKADGWSKEKVLAVTIEYLARLDSRLNIENGDASPYSKYSTIERSIIIDGNQNIVNQSNTFFQNTPLPLIWKAPEPPAWLKWLPNTIIQRQDLLEKMNSSLLSSHDITLHGMAGMGKSTLAAMYVNAYAFPGIFDAGIIWEKIGKDFQSAQCQPILDRWIRLAYGGDIQIHPQLGEHQTYQSAVHDLLGGHGKLLIVLDDVWDRDVIQQLLDALPGDAYLIITTRNARVAQNTRLEIGALGEEDAIELARKWLGNQSNENLRELVNGLGRNALALAIAAAKIGRQRESKQAAAIHSIVNQVEQGLGFGELPLLDQIDERNSPIETALCINYDALLDENSGEHLQKFLRLLGVFAASSDFSIELVASLTSTSLDEAHSFLLILSERSLLNSVKDRWQQHPLVRAYCLALLIKNDEYEWAIQNYVLATMGMLEQLQENLSTNLPRFSLEMSHIYEVGKLLSDRIEKSLGLDPFHVDPIKLEAVLEKQDNESTWYFEKIIPFSFSMLPYLRIHPEEVFMVRRWLLAAGVVAQVIHHVETETSLACKVLLDLGDLFIRSGQSGEGLPYLKVALGELEMRNNNYEMQGRALKSIGEAHKVLGDQSKALEFFQKSLEVSKAVGKHDLQAEVLNNLAELYLASSELEKATQCLQEAIEYFKKEDETLFTIQSLAIPIIQNVGRLCELIDEPNAALGVLELVIEFSQGINDRATQVILFNSKANVYLMAKEHEKAQQESEQAQQIARQLNLPFLQGKVLATQGNIFRMQHKYDLALESLGQALNFARQSGDGQTEAVTLTYQGLVFVAQGKREDALHQFEGVLHLLRRTGNRRYEILVLHQIGNLYISLNQVQRGVEFFQQLLGLMESMNDGLGMATVYSWLTLLFQESGDLQKAMDFMDLMEISIEKIEDKVRKAGPKFLLGCAYVNFGQPAKAIAILKPINEIIGNSGNNDFQENYLLLLGEAHLQIGDHQNAQKYLTDSLALAETNNSFVSIAKSLSSLSMCYLSQDNVERAEEYMKKAVDYGNRHELGIYTPVLLFAMAVLMWRKGNVDSAKEYFESAYDKARAQGNIVFSPIAKIFKGLLLYSEMNRRQEGIRLVEDAVVEQEKQGLRAVAGGLTPSVTRIWLELMKEETNNPLPNSQLSHGKILALLMNSDDWNHVEFITKNFETILKEPAFQSKVEDKLMSDRLKGHRLYQATLEIFYRFLKILASEGVEKSISFLKSPECTLVYTWWSHLQRNNGNSFQALVYINRAIELQASEPLHYVERGLVFRGLNNYSKSLQDFEEAIHRSKGTLGYLGRGVILYEMMYYADALKALEHAVKTEPKNALALQWRAMAYQRMGNYEQAYLDLEKAVSINPQQNDFIYWRALAQLHLKKFSQARLDLETLCQQHKETSHYLAYYLFWLGVIEDKNGNTEKAEANWQKARERFEEKFLGNTENLLIALIDVVKNRDQSSAQQRYMIYLNGKKERQTLISQIDYLALLGRIYPEINEFQILEDWLRRNIEITSKFEIK